MDLGRSLFWEIVCGVVSGGIPHWSGRPFLSRSCPGKKFASRYSSLWRLPRDCKEGSSPVVLPCQAGVVGMTSSRAAGSEAARRLNASWEVRPPTPLHPIPETGPAVAPPPPPPAVPLPRTPPKSLAEEPTQRAARARRPLQLRGARRSKEEERRSIGLRRAEHGGRQPRLRSQDRRSIIGFGKKQRDVFQKPRGGPRRGPKAVPKPAPQAAPKRGSPALQIPI